MHNQSAEKRKYQRFDLKNLAGALDFQYSINAELNIIPFLKGGVQVEHLVYSARALNVSAEGLCVYSDNRLYVGDNLILEFYLARHNSPVHMQGEVKWCLACSGEKTGFNTGIQLLTIEGHSVHDSVYYDEQYRLYWSDVLETITNKQKDLFKNK